MRHAKLLCRVIHSDVNGLLIVGVFHLGFRGCRVLEVHAELPLIIIIVFCVDELFGSLNHSIQTTEAVAFSAGSGGPGIPE